jgi:polar amino acid transport system substrate-binding protein
MKKGFLTILLAVMMILGMTACTSTVNGGKFTLGFDENFPPMGFKDADSSFKGFDIDVAKEVCKRLGVELKLQPIDWNSKELELDNKNIDAIWNGFSVTEERKTKVLFSNPYMKNRQVLVVKSDSTVKTMADLAGKNVGVQAESSAVDALEAAAAFKASVKVVTLDDNMTALMDLENGGLDAVLMDEIVADYNITQKGAKFKLLDDTLAGEEYAIGFRKADTALCNKVNETLSAMAKDGTMAKISTTWFGKDITIIGK